MTEKLASSCQPALTEIGSKMKKTPTPSAFCFLLSAFCLLGSGCPGAAEDCLSSPQPAVEDTPAAAPVPGTGSTLLAVAQTTAQPAPPTAAPPPPAKAKRQLLFTGSWRVRQ